MKQKPRVAIFDFADCEGCELEIADLEEEILDLLEIADIVSFREVMKEHSDNYDIAIVEGSIMRPMDEKRLRDIRSKAKILVAIGACATIGGVNKIRNQWMHDEVIREVYGDAPIQGNELFNVFKTKALNEVVPVDYYIHGCPPDRDDIKRVISALALGKKPEIIRYPVCVECKKNENICQFELGNYCLGPITRAGCKAICPTHNSPCEGCRGLIKKAETECVWEVLQRYNLSYEDIRRRCTMYNYGKEECQVDE
jgi:coenzyme F420-reducing hydrogenase gamma subunit